MENSSVCSVVPSYLQLLLIYFQIPDLKLLKKYVLFLCIQIFKHIFGGEPEVPWLTVAFYIAYQSYS